MKKAISFLICSLFALTILLPVGVLTTACFGCTFELVSVIAFAVLIAVVSVCTVVLCFVYGCEICGKAVCIISALISPASLVNAVFFMLECNRIPIVVSVLISALCCCLITVKLGKPFALKTIALIMSSIMSLPAVLMSFVFVVFGNSGKNTVTQTVVSPNGRYYAQVVDSDQGALGGDTLVDVYESRGLNAVLFRVNKKPQRIYRGEWGEFKNMKVYWKDDNCIVINSVEYRVE